MNSLGKDSHACFHTCVEHLRVLSIFGEVRVREDQNEIGSAGSCRSGLAGSGAWGAEHDPPTVSPTLPRLGRVQAPGGAAAGEEPLAAVRERRTAHLQQRPER